MLWRCGGNRDWADEVVQEIWLVAVRRVRRFDPRKGSFGNWLRGIAANVQRDKLRQRLRRARREKPWNDRAEPVAPDPVNHADRIAAALDVLPPRQEQVLRAKYLDGRTVAEIAACNGKTIKAVESLLSRAREAFHQAYNDNDDRSR